MQTYHQKPCLEKMTRHTVESENMATALKHMLEGTAPDEEDPSNVNFMLSDQNFTGTA